MSNFNPVLCYTRVLVVVFLFQLGCWNICAQEEDFPYPEIEWATYFVDGLGGFSKDGNLYFSGIKPQDAYVNNGYDSLATYVSNPEHPGNLYFGKLGSNQDIEFVELYGAPWGDPGNQPYSSLPIEIEAVDQDGNFYIAGIAKTEVGLGTPGAYHENFYGNWTEPRDVYLPDLDITVPLPSEPCNDAFIVKYDKDGNKLWGSYYNGNQGMERVWLIAGGDYLYLHGTTSSYEGIASPGTYMTEWDDWSAQLNPRRAFVLKLNADDGTPVWGTYLHETHMGINGANGTMQVNSYGYLAWFFEGAIRSLSPEGELYVEQPMLGGASNDGTIERLATDQSGNYFILGSATGNDSIGTPGSFRPTKTFEKQRFIVKYNQEFEKQWGSYLFETHEAGQNSGLPSFGHGARPFIDKQGVYLAIGTQEEGLATPGAYQEENAGGSDIILMKLDSFDGSLKWASYFGGEGHDYGGGIVHKDASENLYLGIAHADSPPEQLATENALFPEPISFNNAMVVKFLHESNVMQTELPHALSFKLYPNPAGSHLYLQSEEAFGSQAEFDVYDLLGKKAASFKATPGSLQNFDISRLSPGAYFLEISHGLQKQYLKFIKQ